MDKIFIDTNIIIYANDKRDPAKQKSAIKTIKSLMKKREKNRSYIPSNGHT